MKNFKVFLALTLFFAVALAQPGDKCAACSSNPELCCRDPSGVAVGCKDVAEQLCCYDGTFCPFCHNATNVTCCHYDNSTQLIATCDKGFKCELTGPNASFPTRCVFNGTACEGCEEEDCCRDFEGVPRSCMNNRTLDSCCFDGSVCPFCRVDFYRDTCCSYSSITGQRRACINGEQCQWETTPTDPPLELIQCGLNKTNCSSCHNGTQCCLVNNVPDSCINATERKCCLDGVHCKLGSECVLPSNFPSLNPSDFECCSGAKGLHCPRGGFPSDWRYCAESSNPSCNYRPRAYNCSDCSSSELCCQSITGQFFGCYDPRFTRCCALDGAHCTALLNHPCFPLAGSLEIGECCSWNANTGYDICPKPGGDPLAIYCAVGGGCQVNPRPPPPPPFNPNPPPYTGSTVGSAPPPSPVEYPSSLIPPRPSYGNPPQSPTSVPGTLPPASGPAGTTSPPQGGSTSPGGGGGGVSSSSTSLLLSFLVASLAAFLLLLA